MSNDIKLRPAERSQAKIRLGLSGPAGSGKTYSALQIAFGLCGDWTKIAIIDTEHYSADFYSDMGKYNVLSLDPPFSPERYIEAIEACENAKMEVIIIDSITHEWDGPGGCLEIQEKLGGKWQNWAEVTPRHRQFIDTILSSSCHVITCVRSKVDYALSQDNGKVKVEKVGMKDVTREGFDYELTLDLDLDLNHNARCSKDRTGLFMDQPPFVPSSDIGRRIAEWCVKGSPAPIRQRPTKNGTADVPFNICRISGKPDKDWKECSTSYLKNIYDNYKSKCSPETLAYINDLLLEREQAGKTAPESKPVLPPDTEEQKSEVQQ